MMATWQHWMVGQIDASIAAAALLAAAVFWRRRLSPKVRSAILLIAMISLALPPWLRSPWSEALVDLPPIDDTRLLAAEWLTPRLTVALFSIGLVVTAVLLIRLAWQTRAMARRLQSLAPAPAALEARVNALACQASIDLRVSPADGPFASGLVRKVIVLPAPLIDLLDHDAMDAVLAHEVAHHARRDLWWLAAGAVLKSVVWFNPLAHLIAGALVAAREDGSDDWAVTHTSRDPFSYAHALLQSARSMTMAPPMAAGAHPMGPRLRRLLDERADRGHRLTPVGVFAILIAAAVALPGAHMPSLEDAAEHGAPGRAGDDPVIVIKRVLGERGLEEIRNR
ncbi:MAG: M56 family metallopeptidase [Vicinamibacterales bacterium]